MTITKTPTSADGGAAQVQAGGHPQGDRFANYPESEPNRSAFTREAPHARGPPGDAQGRVELPTGQRSSLVLPQHPGFQVGFQQRHVPRLLLAHDIDERGEEQARQAMRPGIEPRPKPCACRFLRQRHGQGDRDRAAVDPGPPVRPVVLGAFLLYQSGKAKGSFRCLTRIFSSYRRTSAGRYPA